MISICIIVKNESKNLKECLSKLINLGYEIIIVDTGSMDETKEVAKQFTDFVYDFEWCNDFSVARNYAITKANNDYILMVDSDEFITQFEKEKVEQLIQKNPEAVGRIHRHNSFISEDAGFNSNELVNRLFAKQKYTYVGKVHEQIERCNHLNYDTYEVPISMDHSGYLGGYNERKKKADRNIKLLEIMLRENEDPYVIYQLGKSYYYKREYKQAVGYFARALTFDLDPRLEYVIDMVEMYGYALINSGQLETALLLEDVYDEFCASADFVFMMGYAFMQNGMFEKAIHCFLDAAEHPESKVEGVNSYLAYYNAGVIYECLGDKKQAKKYYALCGEYELAVQGHSRCI